MPAPLLAAAGIAGGLSLLGTFVNSAFNASEARKNRNFQERMADTSHQREVLDLERAGLNPMLSARLGGAATPPGSAAQASNSTLGHDVATGIQVAQQADLVRAQVADLNASSGLKAAQTQDINAQQIPRIDLMVAEKEAQIQSGKLSAENINKVRQEIENLKAQKALIQAQTLSTARDAASKRLKSDIMSLPYNAMSAVKSFAEKHPFGARDRGVRGGMNNLRLDESGLPARRRHGASGKY